MRYYKTTVIHLAQGVQKENHWKVFTQSQCYYRHSSNKTKRK